MTDDDVPDAFLHALIAEVVDAARLWAYETPRSPRGLDPNEDRLRRAVAGLTAYLQGQELR